MLIPEEVIGTHGSKWSPSIGFSLDFAKESHNHISVSSNCKFLVQTGKI
jgi:hypothetical protein